MEFDEEQCFRAVRGRDPRFDGRFFTAVVTTSIYCRPICPARTPRRENMRFFPCAAAAAEAGFRPCLRCRPETAPGTPAWAGSSTSVGRALRLIAEGALDEAPIDALAARLGMGARQLRRLFDAHLGVSPLQVAQTRRLHFARRMLDETALPVTAIVGAAGFRSVRRFNAAFHAAYGRPPSAVRRRASAGGGAHGSGEMLELRLSYRPPLDREALVAFLAPRATPGVESVAGGVYRRTMAVDGETGVITIGAARSGKGLALCVPVSLSTTLLEMAERARRLFDLDADPVAVTGVLGGDALLRASVRARPGLRVVGSWDRFESAVRVILGQQVSVAAATTLAGRIAATFGAPLKDRAVASAFGLRHVFPGPERLADAPLERLGIIGARAESIRGLARAVSAGEPLLEAGAGLEETLGKLQALPGIGPWTAAVIAMRALGEPDAFPAGDLVLRRVAGEGAGSLVETRLRERAEAWRPWRAYAAQHLWSMAAAAQAAPQKGAR